MGDNVFVQYSILHSEGGLYIGNNVGIAVGTIIWTVEHQYRDGIAIPYILALLGLFPSLSIRDII